METPEFFTIQEALDHIADHQSKISRIEALSIIGSTIENIFQKLDNALEEQDVAGHLGVSMVQRYFRSHYFKFNPSPLPPHEYIKQQMDRFRHS